MDIEKGIKKSFRWSAVTEIIVKIITPVLNAVLARILLPEDFAALATIVMFISFGEIFIDSGFKKYLIQREFKTEEEYQKNFDVAFWTNLLISFLLWGFMAIFSKSLSSFFGSPELWLGFIVAGSIFPLYSIGGIFGAKLQKDLQFKKLFYVRTVTALIPLFVTIPLALIGFKHWALIIGNVVSIFAHTIALIVVSNHRVHLFFSFNVFKEMYSACFWTMFDGIAVWLTNWVDSLIIAKYMSDYYLGMYKNSLSTVNTLFSIVTSAIIPVLYVGLSKYQNDDKKFSDFFNTIQCRLAMLLLPLGVGVFIYRDLAVMILFGNKWTEAANIVGIIALTTALRTVFVSICSDAYRAKAKFRIPLVFQIIDICLIIPVCIISATKGFWYLVYARALIKLDLIIPELIVMKKVLKVELGSKLKNLLPIIVATAFMTGLSIVLRSISDSIIWNFVSIGIAAAAYIIILMLIPSSRNDLRKLLKS